MTEACMKNESAMLRLKQAEVEIKRAAVRAEISALEQKLRQYDIDQINIVADEARLLVQYTKESDGVS